MVKQGGGVGPAEGKGVMLADLLDGTPGAAGAAKLMLTHAEV
jgi:hypothetical protein